MTNFLKNTLLDSGSDKCNSLEGVLGYTDLDVAFVQEKNWFYRFFAASTVAPDGNSIIAPGNISPPASGRWIRQGPPGFTGPNPRQPMNVSSCVPSQEVMATGMTDSQVIPETLTTITNILLRFEDIDADSFILFQAVVGGVVAGTNVAPLVHIQASEFDADDNLLGVVTMGNSRQQSPIVTATQNAVVASSGLYQRSNASTSYIEARVQAAAATPDTGSWTLDPAVGVSGGAILSGTRIA